MDWIPACVGMTEALFWPAISANLSADAPANEGVERSNIIIYTIGNVFWNDASWFVG